MDMKRKINNQKSEYEIERDLAMGLDGDEDEGESVQPSLYFTNFYRLTFTNCISFYSTSVFFFIFISLLLVMFFIFILIFILSLVFIYISIYDFYFIFYFHCF